jgi:TPR repeat protein
MLEPLAEQGNLKAMTLVGGIYVGGFGVEKDCEKGEPMVLRAAQAG